MIKPRFYISAAHKSSGKTTISIGLCAAFTRHGKNVQSFKKGPDYIDPLWLASACGNRCLNLDFNTMAHEEILGAVARESRDKELIVVEGNKGLYDGIDLEGSNSNAAVAKLLASPVILVIDAQGATRGVAPLLLGYQLFDRNVNIAGVIFNKVGGSRHESKLRQVTEHYTDIPVLGAVHKSDDLVLTERHLGLMPYNESDRANQKISRIADGVARQVDLKALLDMAAKAPPLPMANPDYALCSASAKDTPVVKIGLCRDASFGFYYADDLVALERCGAELVTVNTLSDRELPDIDGLFIGGGFPETRMQTLAANETMRESMRQAIENGLPVYAECGGLMYLSRSIIWQSQQYNMVGIIPADAVMHEKPQGRGYVKLRETTDMSWPGERSRELVSAHEFHYSRLENFEGNLTDKGRFAYRVERGYGINGEYDGWVYKNLLASYTHMRDTSKFHWVERFVNFVREVKQQRQSHGQNG